MSSPKGRILYTEDDPDSRDLVIFILERDGYQVTCAESGPEALALAETEQFDLILVDNCARTHRSRTYPTPQNN